jgi:hypothetical protein
MEEVTSMTKLTISPVTRIEGHLKIDVDVEGGKVVDAKSTGTMFRNHFEGQGSSGCIPDYSKNLRGLPDRPWNSIGSMP